MESLVVSFLWLIIYGVCGWIFESLLCSIKEHKFISRGFLNGPYCLFYGIGALLTIYISGTVDNIAIQVIISAVVMCILKFATSYILEKTYTAKWWNYSNHKFNICGCVSLFDIIIFGIIPVLIINFLHPSVEKYIASVPHSLLRFVFVIFMAAFLIDIFTTFFGMRSFKGNIEIFKEYCSKNHEGNNGQAISNIFNSQQQRMLKAFPSLKDNISTLKIKHK